MIAEIILKKICGQLDREEEIIFKKWLSKNDENFLTYQRLKELHQQKVLLPNINNLHPQKAWEVISIELKKNKSYKKNNFSSFGLIRYAAFFVGLVGCFFLYKSYQEDEITKLVPDSTEITLELGNGEIQILSSNGANKVIDSKGGFVGREENGVVDYSQNDIPENEIPSLEYNTIHIPNGKTFKIVLSDGTSVHLNSGSSLKYPIKFIKGKNREVSLIGEAFFDVHKNERSPFIVTFGKMDVRVLGTKFNVSSYPEDTHQSTVLVEGSVRLYETGADYDEYDSTLLYPGYKADWNTTDKQMMVNKVNTELYTGWIDGKLAMKKIDFLHIIQKLQRRYNVKIINEYEELNDRIFTATFETETIEEVLETFKVETPFAFEIKEDSIRIYKQLKNHKQ